MSIDREHLDKQAIRPPQKQANSESVDRKSNSDERNVDNGENQVSNGTQSTPPHPGIARVGNTGAETTD